MSSTKLPIPVLLALASIHCGAGRSDLGVYVSEDATTTIEESSLGGDTSRTVLDGGFGPDASTVKEAGTLCTQPVFTSALAGDNVSCKFHVSWTCGATKYEGGGACAPPGSKQGFGSGITGACIKNGVSVANINNPDPKSCSCTDGALTVSAVVKACGFPTGG